jgi:hypothetical protein
MVYDTIKCTPNAFPRVALPTFGPVVALSDLTARTDTSVDWSKADFAGTGHQYAMAQSKVDKINDALREAHAEAAA